MSNVSDDMITKIMTVSALLVLVSSPSWATDSGYYAKHEHKFEQKVEAEGYYMIYQDVGTEPLQLQNYMHGSASGREPRFFNITETLQLQNYMHGSGIVDASTLISSNQTKTKYYPQDKDTLVYESPVYGYESNISFIEQNAMSYAPMAVAYGTGYYAKNPIVYNSKLKERTEGKSLQGGVLMNHQIEYASAFQKDISVDLQFAINYTESTVYGFRLVKMEVDEEVMAGTVHVGELMTDQEFGWKKPQIEIDENYVGDIKLTKKMVISTTTSPEELKTDWLSCCGVGGYDEMEYDDKIWGEEEIFGCTCRDVVSIDRS